jgi:uncharacterized membrane protein YeiH
MPPPAALLTSFLPWFDLFGIAVFAASGALAAARLRLTFVSFGFFALITGVGGGTVRDLLIGVPVFWVQDWRMPAACMASAALVWVTPARWWRGSALDWFDAIGLAVYATFGTAKALAAGVPALPAFMMGVITACVGGIIRDLLAGAPSILLRPELYVTAAALSAASFVGLEAAGVARDLAFFIAAAAGFALRALAIARGLSIPSYQR